MQCNKFNSLFKGPYMTYEQISAKFNDFNSKNLQSIIALTEKTMGRSTKLAEISFDTSKSLLDEVSGTMQSVMAVKDPQAFMSMAQDGKMEGITNKLTAHQQAVSEVIREATDEFAKLAEVSVEQMKSSMKEWLDSISANAPAGSEAFVNAMKTSLDTTLQGVDQMQATLKEVATNLEKTTEQAVETIKGQVATVKKTAAKTRRATRR
jgi:hypothetical protein